jgi:hypothetical protein
MKKITGENCKNSLYLETVITLREYREMKHCIGFTKDKVKREKFTEWRNRFVLGISCDATTWEKLVGMGLAKCYTIDSNNLLYCLTDAGFEFIARYENVVIVREED